MKRIWRCLLTAFLSMMVGGALLGTTPDLPPSSTGIISIQSLEAKAILDRVNEIKAMDKSKLGLKEKKQLRKELHSAKKQLKQISGGVYISAGSLLLIAIILILLL